MAAALLTLFIGIAVFALAVRNLVQAWRKGTIVWRPYVWDRRENPILFGLIVMLCLGFAVAMPMMLTSEWPRIADALF